MALSDSKTEFGAGRLLAMSRTISRATISETFSLRRSHVTPDGPNPLIMFGSIPLFHSPADFTTVYLREKHRPQIPNATVSRARRRSGSRFLSSLLRGSADHTLISEFRELCFGEFELFGQHRVRVLADLGHSVVFGTCVAGHVQHRARHQHRLQLLVAGDLHKRALQEVRIDHDVAGVVDRGARSEE